MNIKSLLFGSAAALVAVSGARAADAVVIAEPEPMEYVRICDTYGAGFYYIPGTETCIRFSGLIRYDIDYSEDFEYVITESDIDAIEGLSVEDREEIRGRLVDRLEDRLTSPLDPDDGPVLDDFIDANENGIVDAGDILLFDGLDDGWAKNAVARLNVDVRSETEYGTFRRFMRLQGNVLSGDDDGGVDVIYAYIELGGLLVGLYDTLYDGDISPEFDSGGGSAAHQMRYTFTGANGFVAQASIEVQSYNTDDYQANLGARLAFTQAWGGFAAFAMYDGLTEEFGVKGIASFNLADAWLFEVLATYESGYGDFSVSSATLDGYESSLAGAVSWTGDVVTVRFGGQYFWNQHTLGTDSYRIGGNVDYKVVENLLLRFQANWNGGDNAEFIDAKVRFEGGF
jgi:hypothetical protein